MTRPAHIARLSGTDDDPFVPEANDRYFNRELSWLAFNRRVLEEACNTAHPLLERLRFLSISGNNLDEFFMVRVAGLKGQQLKDVDRRSADGLTAGQQLAAISEETDALMESQQAVWGDLRELLDNAGLHVLRRDEVDSDVEAWLETHFREQIFPILTPQALDPSHPFPFIPNKGLGVMFDLVRNSDREPVRELVMVPGSAARFLRIPGDPARYISIEAMLKRFAPLLFPGYTINAAASFRVLRDSDIEIDEEAEDLVRYFANAIKRRRRGRVIRLEVETGISDALSAILKEELGGTVAIVTESGNLLGIGDLDAVVDEDRPDLKFPPYIPRFPERIREFGGDCFAAIKTKDIVVHHP
ncbi:MAG: RNA degradosome polyphosphate kinase, partial [Sphingomonas bacterium]|nr:RNA degradosome polyphosphate kinase [Sphingomonas bacterium]